MCCLRFNASGSRLHHRHRQWHERCASSMGRVAHSDIKNMGIGFRAGSMAHRADMSPVQYLGHTWEGE